MNKAFPTRGQERENGRVGDRAREVADVERAVSERGWGWGRGWGWDSDWGRGGCWWRRTNGGGEASRCWPAAVGHALAVADASPAVRIAHSLDEVALGRARRALTARQIGRAHV